MHSVAYFCMLEQATIKRINEFVYAKPRTIQEIALLLKVNWRTADSYVQKISEEHGTLSVRTFREGTRGALKVVFWSNLERANASQAQEVLFKKIETSSKKEDFSPLDIYQFVDPKQRRAFADLVDLEETSRDRNIIPLLRKAEKEIYIFSGNLSFINLKQGKETVLDVFEELAKRISIKILARVDVAGFDNIRQVLAINQRIGRDAIEVRHSAHPLRGIIVDGKVARLREIRLPERYREGELKGKTYVYYELYDEDWIGWLQKVFWSIFRPAVDAGKRINDIESISKLI
ncbi:MAG: hypothetical protein J4451_02135 [DPANN group archaeon]|nr:hypothetical protein [DPANN group archaeon]